VRVGSIWSFNNAQTEGHDLTVFAGRPAWLEPFAGTEVSIAELAEMGAVVMQFYVCIFDAAGLSEADQGAIAATGASPRGREAPCPSW
jgi:hypothetical protein